MLDLDLYYKIHKAGLKDYLQSVPFHVLRERLYTPQELFGAYVPGCPESFDRCMDTVVYRHMVGSGKITSDPMVQSARSMHDTSIRNCMQEFLTNYDQRQVVGVMGGHALPRTDAAYRQVVEVSKQLTEMGYLMISGGGPGAMEATHLGAWLAGRPDEVVDEVLQMLSEAPCFKDAGWFEAAYKVTALYPQKKHYQSLAIPTWFYGHEPPTIFATTIAKFFDNSIREDVILTEAYGGLIFMPGSAGTLQEVFQEAVQNHYVSLGFPSPMVFVGTKFWNEEVPVYPFIQHMIRSGRYQNMIVDLVDDNESIIRDICMPPDSNRVEK